MSRQVLWLGLFVVCVFWTAGDVRGAEGVAPTEQLSGALELNDALEAMNRWLGDNDNGRRWRAFLGTDALQAELGQGRLADRGVVARSLAAFESDASGLDRRPFVAVRTQLRRWWAELNSPEEQELAEWVRQSKGLFRPVPAEQASSLKVRLLASMRQFEKFLLLSGQANAEAWQAYLNWGDLRTELDKETPDVRVLSQVMGNFYRNEAGLEMAPFDRVRTQLQRYINILRAQQTSNLDALYGRAIDQLATNIEKLRALPHDPGAQQGVVQVLSFLDRAQQAPEVIQAVHTHLARPNLYARVSERLVEQAVAQDVEEESDVRENILGTSVVGRALMRGQLSAEFVEHANSARIDVMLRGKAHSKNVGTNRGVRIRSNGVTSITARKPMYFSADGIADQPTQADCETKTQISSIYHRIKLVEKMAWKQAGKTKHQAEQVASRRAEVRVAEQMDKQADELLAEARTNYAEKFRLPLLRRGEFPERMAVRTTDASLHLELLQANLTQLAANTNPPEEDAASDVSVRLHESLVANLSRAFIGGVTLTDERLEELVEEATGEVPEELRVTQDKDPWSITFSSTAPLQAEFRGQTVKITISGRRFTQGERVIDSPVEISATYQLEKTDGGARLKRQGEVEVEFVRGASGAQDIALRTLLRKKFAALFSEEKETTGIPLQGRLGDQGQLKLSVMAAENAWLALGWNHEPQPKVAGPEDGSPEHLELAEK